MRTSEKAPELVQAAINRLLDDSANQTVRLKKINMAFDQPRSGSGNEEAAGGPVVHRS